MTTTPENPNPPNRFYMMRALGYNNWGYDNLIHQFFVTWCEAMANKFYHKDRDLIADERLFSYYKNQWEILVEKRMMNEYGSYLKRKIPGTEKTYYGFIYEFAMELEQYYPASLVKQPKPKTKPKYEFNLN